MLFKHNIKIAWRNLMKYKLQTLISIVSLAIGMYLFSFASVMLLNDFLYDSKYPDTENTYVIVDEKSSTDLWGDSRIVDYIKKHCPEVENITCFAFYPLELKEEYRLPAGGGTSFRTQFEAWMIDDSFQDIYGVKVIEGRKRLNLKRGEIALSKNLAETMFPDGDALGQVIDCEEYEYDGITPSYKVVAIYEDRIHNETLNKNAGLISGKVIDRTDGHVMVKIKPGTYDSLEKKLNNATVKGYDLDEKYKCPHRAINVKDMHRYRVEQSNVDISPSYMRAFLILAVIIITCALFNYITMLVARTNIRQRELALRYVNGAKTGQLAWMVVTEIMIILVIACIIARIFDASNDNMYIGFFAEVDPDIHSKGFLLSSLFVAAISLLITTITVSFINKKQLNVSLSKKAGATVKSWMYRVNVGVQFVLSLSAIFATFVLSYQLNYWKTGSGLGVTFENLYGINQYERYGPTTPDLYKKSLLLFLDSAKNLPCVEKAGLLYHKILESNEIKYKGRKWDINHLFLVTESTFDMMQFQLSEGEFISDSDTDKVVMTKKLSDKYKVGIGDTLNIYDSKKTVAGIIKNCYNSPKEEVFDMIFISAYSDIYKYVYYGDMVANSCLVNLKDGYNGDDLWNILSSKIKNQKHPLFNCYIRDYENNYESLMNGEYTALTFLRFMTFASILLAISGVFGIVSLSCEHRRKEIAIRKVNGAKLPDIMQLFLSEYMYMLLASAVIVFPIGYYLSQKWSANYEAAPAAIHWWTYPFLILVLALVIFVSVFWQIYKASSENPSEVMKAE